MSRLQDKDTRQQLIEAALDILLRDGIQGFSQSKVARQAGLRQSHLTYYFPTRNDLLKVVVEHGCQLVINSLAPGAAPDERSLEEFRLGMCDKVCDSGIARMMVAITVAAEEDPSLKSWISDFDRRMFDNKTQTFKRLGIEASEQDMALFHATVAGIAIRNLNSNTDEERMAARRNFLHAFDRLLRDAGLKSKSEKS